MYLCLCTLYLPACWVTVTIATRVSVVMSLVVNVMCVQWCWFCLLNLPGCCLSFCLCLSLCLWSSVTLIGMQSNTPLSKFHTISDKHMFTVAALGHLMWPCNSHLLTYQFSIIFLYALIIHSIFVMYRSLPKLCYLYKLWHIYYNCASLKAFWADPPWHSLIWAYVKLTAAPKMWI